MTGTARGKGGNRTPDRTTTYEELDIPLEAPIERDGSPAISKNQAAIRTALDEFVQDVAASREPNSSPLSVAKEETTPTPIGTVRLETVEARTGSNAPGSKPFKKSEFAKLRDQETIIFSSGDVSFNMKLLEKPRIDTVMIEIIASLVINRGTLIIGESKIPKGQRTDRVRISITLNGDDLSHMNLTIPKVGTKEIEIPPAFLLR